MRIDRGQPVARGKRDDRRDAMVSRPGGAARDPAGGTAHAPIAASISAVARTGCRVSRHRRALRRCIERSKRDPAGGMGVFGMTDTDATSPAADSLSSSTHFRGCEPGEKAGDVAARPREAFDEFVADRIGAPS